MSHSVEWNPFKELEKVRGNFDRVFDRFRHSAWLTEFDNAGIRPRIDELGDNVMPAKANATD